MERKIIRHERKKAILVILTLRTSNWLCNSGDLRLTRDQCQYSLIWASLVAQLVKNPPALQETWVRSLGWKDPLEKGKATHSRILAWRIPWTVQSWGRKESDMTERLSLGIMSYFTYFFPLDLHSCLGYMQKCYSSRTVDSLTSCHKIHAPYLLSCVLTLKMVAEHA